MTLAERLALSDMQGLTDWQAAAALNAPDPTLSAKRVDVPTYNARGVLLATGEWGGVVLLSRTAPSVEVPAALVAAAIVAVDTMSLTTVIEATKPATWTAVQSLLGALVAAGVVSTGTRDILLALADVPQSWAESEGLSPITARDVGLARGGIA